MKDLSYMSPVITELAAYFRCGHSIKELKENLDYRSPEEIYSSPEMLMHDIDCIFKHLDDSNITTASVSIPDNTNTNSSGYVNCGNNAANNIFGVNYDDISDDEILSYMKLIEDNLVKKIASIGQQEQFKDFLKSLADFSKSFDSNLSDSDAEELEKFRSIVQQCDAVVRETTKNSQKPSSINSLKEFVEYLNQANSDWMNAENYRMSSASYSNGVFINPITKINELTTEIQKLNMQLAEKEKEISDLKKKKPVANNK